MISLQVKSHLEKVPPAVKTFAARALLLLVLWITVYHVVLKPYRLPDRWLSNATARATASLMTSWYGPAEFLESDNRACVVMGSRSVIRIGDPCNALDLMALFTGFILCLPTSLKRMMVFCGAGIAAIFVLNVLRCYSLAWLSLNRHEWVDFAHKYAFTAIVYCFIFYGWICYTKNYEIKNDKQ